MKTRLLYRALYGRRFGRLIAGTFAVCGLYGGYLLWFVCTRYLPGPDVAAWQLASLIGWTLCSFLALARIPDALFTNRRLTPTRWLPIHSKLLVRIMLERLLLLQTGIFALVFWAFLLHTREGREPLFLWLLAGVLFAALTDLAIFLLSVLLSRVLSARSLGYGFILLQYGGFFLLTALSMQIFLHLPIFPSVPRASTLLAEGTLLLLFAALCRAATARWYEHGVAKAQQFQCQHHLRAATPTRLHNPYLLLEWKRVLRNKELVFYTTIKNLVTLALLAALFRQRALLFLPDPSLLILVLLSASSAINTIASTAYSSDASRRCYDFLPVGGARLFSWKVLVAAFWGAPLGLLVWFVSIFLLHPTRAEAALLLLYALSSDLLCAGLGVWLDQRMPRTPQSTNELLHGNLSKICVLAGTLTLALGVIRVAESRALFAATALNCALITLGGVRFLLRKEEAP